MSPVPVGILASARVSGTTLPVTAGLVGWYDADDPSTLSFGTGVSQWRDKSGLGRHLNQPTGSLQPFRTGTINGRNAITFDIIDDYLDTGSFTVAQPFTVFMARNAASSDSGWFASVGGSFQIFQGANQLILYAGSTQIFMSSGSGIHAWTFEVNGSSSVVRRDGSSFGSGNPGTAGTTTGWRTRERNLTAGYPHRGLDGEYIIYDRILTSTERGLIESYLMTRWV